MATRDVQSYQPGVSQAPSAAGSMTPNAFGADLGERIAQFGAGLAHLGGKIQDAQRESKVLDAKIGTRKALDDLQRQFMQNPDQDQAWKDYQVGAQALIDTIPEQYKFDGLAREQIQQNTLNAAEIDSQQVFGRYWQRTTDENRSKTFDQITELQKQAATATNPTTAEYYREQVKDLLSNEGGSRHWFSGGEREKILKKSLSDMDENDGRTMLNVDLKKGLEMLESKQGGEDSAYRNYADLDPIKRQELIWMAKNKLKMFNSDQHLGELYAEVQRRALTQGDDIGSASGGEFKGRMAQLGINEDNQRKLLTQWDYYQKANAALKKADTTPLDQRSVLEEDYKKFLTKPEDAEFSNRGLQALREGFAQKDSMAQKDPGAYADSINPPRQGAPMDAIINQRVAYQKYMGYRVAPYSNQEAEQLKTRAASGDVHVFEQIQQQNGKNTGAAVRQLLDSGASPLMFEYQPGNAGLNSAITDALRQQSAAKATGKSYGPQGAEKEGFNLAIQAGVKQMQEDMKIPPEQMPQAQEALIQLANGLYATKGSDAASEAIKLLHTSQGSRKGNAWVPNNLPPPVQQQVKDVSVEMVRQLDKLPIITAANGNDPLGTKQALQGAVLSPIRGGEGFELRDPQGHPVLVNVDNKPVKVQFDTADIGLFTNKDADSVRQNANLRSATFGLLSGGGNIESRLDTQKLMSYLSRKQVEAEKLEQPVLPEGLQPGSKVRMSDIQGKTGTRVNTQPQKGRR